MESQAPVIAGVMDKRLVQDANGHQAASLTGGLGKANYKPTRVPVAVPMRSMRPQRTPTMRRGICSRRNRRMGRWSTTTYDALGHATSQNDPDSGTSTATYDPNGNVTQTVDARGGAGTIYAGMMGSTASSGTIAPTVRRVPGIPSATIAPPMATMVSAS